MANKPVISITKELKIPQVKEGFVEERLKRALDDICWQCTCIDTECEDCVLEFNNFIKIGRSN